jgi:hypothetical protein
VTILSCDRRLSRLNAFIPLQSIPAVMSIDREHWSPRVALSVVKRLYIQQVILIAC